MTEAEIENRIAAIEMQVNALTKIAGHKTITSSRGEDLSPIEQVRKRLFGIARDNMASNGGKIVG